ncbi:fungal-specific transcription factor domain-containing protein [Aspergillus crustosus]
MVMSMMPNPAGGLNRGSDSGTNVHPDLKPATPADGMSLETPIDTHSECGSMRGSGSELNYVGGGHWVAILDSIADLKDHLDREEQLRLAGSSDDFADDQWSHDGTVSRPWLKGAFLLYGSRRPTSPDEILSALPPKYAVDRCISRYFNYLDLVSSSTVHGPSFLREYDAFWTEPSSAPVIWIGLLFSMICMACLASDHSRGPDVEQQSLQVKLYREKIVQCLLLGRFTKAGPYVLETIINYNYVEFIMNPDAHKDMWYLLGLEVNLARRMGYHRDPSHFPNIPPFQGEMRRRLWATVLMGDILISSQMGMPRMISDWQYDTSEPRNLNDDNFDKDAKELPPSRPENELTAALGIIARTRMLKALGMITDLTSAVKPCQYTEVMRVDSVLQEATNSIPPPLKMKSLEASLTDSPQVVVSRLFIQHMFYKGQIMLHCRFAFTQGSLQDDAAYSYSRKVSLDASLGTLAIQDVLDAETRPGGQLHIMRWRVTSSMNHQFLTATMLLCSLLHHGQTLGRETEIRAALQRARTIWMRKSSTSEEAKKATETVNLVLTGTGGCGGDAGNTDEHATGETLTTQNADDRFDVGGTTPGIYDGELTSDITYILC